MKKIFLWAVLSSAFCISCEITDETLSEKTNNPAVAKLQQDDDSKVYQTILEHFIYNRELPYEENLKKFEQHVNYFMANHKQSNKVYEFIDIDQAKFLITADETVIRQLNYSSEAKNIIYSIIYLHLDIVPSLQDKNENRLVQLLYALHHDGNGDDKWKKNNKTIAFAYGAQYSFIQAVLYAGAVELSKFR